MNIDAIDALSAEDYLRLLVATGGECTHPPRYRRPIPGAHPPERAMDPRQWECAVCGTWQVADIRGQEAPR